VKSRRTRSGRVSGPAPGPSFAGPFARETPRSAQSTAPRCTDDRPARHEHVLTGEIGVDLSHAVDPVVLRVHPGDLGLDLLIPHRPSCGAAGGGRRSRCSGRSAHLGCAAWRRSARPRTHLVLVDVVDDQRDGRSSSERSKPRPSAGSRSPGPAHAPLAPALPPAPLRWCWRRGGRRRRSRLWSPSRARPPGGSGQYRATSGSAERHRRIMLGIRRRRRIRSAGRSRVLGTYLARSRSHESDGSQVVDRGQGESGFRGRERQSGRRCRRREPVRPGAWSSLEPIRPTLRARRSVARSSRSCGGSGGGEQQETEGIAAQGAVDQAHYQRREESTEPAGGADDAGDGADSCGAASVRGPAETGGAPSDDRHQHGVSGGGWH
jgi:hypothetical protein